LAYVADEKFMRKMILAIIGFFADLLELLPSFLKRELFRMAARSIGVKHAIFDGKQGAFEAPVYDRIIWPNYIVHGAFDAATCDLLKHFFKSGSGTLIDVGANVGMICIPTKQHAPGIDVYAVEADSDNFECLRMNAFRAGIPNIVLFERAAFRCESVIEFERSGENSGDHRIRTKKTDQRGELFNESSRTATQVQASALDSMIPLSGLKSPVILKCDVQGAEADVLAGAAKLLNLVDVMIIEFWPYGLKRFGTNFEELLSFFPQFHYGARFNSKDEVSIRPVPIHELIGQLREFYANDTGIKHCDLVLSKKSF
jgi:FkbM family methyltransferase